MENKENPGQQQPGNDEQIKALIQKVEKLEADHAKALEENKALLKDKSEIGSQLDNLRSKVEEELARAEVSKAAKDQPREMSDEELADLALRDPLKVIDMKVEKLKKELMDDREEGKKLIMEVNERQKRRDLIAEQQNLAAEKITEFGLDWKDEIRKHREDIGRILRDDPVLNESKEGVLLAWLRVKADSGEIGNLRVRGKSVDGISGGSGEQRATLPPEAKAIYDKLDLKKGGISEEKFAEQLKGSAEEHAKAEAFFKFGGK